MYFKETINIFFVLQVISKVVLSQLERPQNVRITSENLHSVLVWSVPPQPRRSADKYSVQYYFDDWVGWRDVSWCVPTSAARCNFTAVARPSVRLTLRVRAESANRTSDWSTTEPFLAIEQTRLGPPGLTLSSIPGGLLVQITDASPDLRPEFGDDLEYIVVFWEQDTGRKEHRRGLSSIVTLDKLKAGQSYCVRVQYVLPQKKGDSSEPVCNSIPESEDDSYRRTVWIVLVAMVLLVAVTCVCLICIYRKYDILKRALQPPIGLPDHFQRFLMSEKFDQLPQMNACSPDSTELVISVIEDDEGGEETSHPAHGPYNMPHLCLNGAGVDHFPACTSPDLANGLAVDYFPACTSPVLANGPPDPHGQQL